MASLTSRILQDYDKPIWLVIQEAQIPYSVEDIESRVGRARRSVLASLRRLERRQRVKEVNGGWQRMI